MRVLVDTSAWVDFLNARDRDLDAILDSGLLKAGRWLPPSARR